MAEVLSLTTERKRRIVKIDGIDLEMLDRDELDLASGVKLRTLVELGKKYQTLTEDEARKVSEGLKAAMMFILPGAGGALETLKRLSDDQRLTILLRFLKGSEAATPSPASEPQPA